MSDLVIAKQPGPDTMNIARIKARCHHWKTLAVKRRKQCESKDRQTKKLKEKVIETQRQLDDATKEIKRLEKSQALQQNPDQTIQINIQVVCVFLFIFGAISCRAVPRILKFMKNIKQFCYPKIPCYVSVINWVCRAGLGYLNSVKQLADKKWLAIVDASVVYSGKKALVVLRIPLDYFLNHNHAPTLEDVECIGIKLGEVWNYQTVNGFLEEIFQRIGFPVALLKDGGYDLAKGAKILASKYRNIEIISDVGHVVANALKKKYGKNSLFHSFLSKINFCCKKMFQTKISFLKPPRIRTKGRFQNIAHVIEWSQKILDILAVPGKAKTGSLIEKLREALPGFRKLKEFILRFQTDCRIANEFMMELKNNGLNQKTYQKAKKIVQGLPKKSSLKKNLLIWLGQQMRVQCRLQIGQTPLLVSTDSIESLMGRIKHVVERNPVQEFGRMILAAPLFCGKLSEEKIESYLQHCSHQDLQEWQQKYLSDSVRRKRNIIFRP